MADIRIPYSKIKKGKSPNGKVYFTAYSEENQFGFEECNCEALYCLPIENYNITANDLPKEILVKGYKGSIASKISIRDIKVDVSDDLTPFITVTVMGEKTFDSNSYEFDSFGYQLIDEEGYTVETGMIMLNQLKKGDKFKDDSIRFYDLIPGEKYTLEFIESDY